MKNDIKLFDTKIFVKKHFCSLYNDSPVKIDIPQTNLYIRYKGCNARCKFCIWYDSANTFNEEKYIKILEEIKSNIRLNKIVFTGGEPTLNWRIFKKNINIARKHFPKTQIFIDTNGYNLEKLFNDNIINKINSVALSRHHYDDKLNNEIFQTKIISATDIKKIQKKNPYKFKLHLTCNLIKGYIDNKEKIYKYFENAASLGIKSVSIIDLMPVNEYCKTDNIKYNIDNLQNEFFYETKQMFYDNKCSCKNYVYVSPKTMKTLIVYYKYTMKPFEMLNGLTFDGKILRQGFNGKIILS